MPRIGALCRRAFRSASDEEERAVLIAGVAAATGLLNISHFLDMPEGTHAECSACGWDYEITPIGRHWACYASPVPPGEMYGRTPENDPSLKDWEEGAPSRADSLLRAFDGEITDERVRRLLELATEVEAALAEKIKRFLGTFHCVKCNHDVTPTAGFSEDVHPASW